MTITQMLSNALASTIAFLPNLLAALLILVVGLLVASLLAMVTRRALQGIGLPRRRSVRELVENEKTLERLPRLAGRLVYWLLTLVVVGLAVDALQLAWLSAGVAQILAYLPSVLAAAAILLVAYVLASYVHRQAQRKQTQAGPDRDAPQIWPAMLRAGIYTVAAFMALQELGIATTIVTSAFIIGLGAIALAAAISFGLGNRELAGRIMRDWYERNRSESAGAWQAPHHRRPGDEPPPVSRH